MKVQTDNSIGWKKEWHKLVVLLAALGQTISFLIVLSDYRNMPNEGSISDTIWKAYEMQLKTQCSLRLMSAVIFFGILFIGTYAKSKESLRRAEMIFLIILFGVWLGIGFCFELLSYDQGRLLFGFFLVLIGVCVVYTLIKKKE